MYLGIVIFTAHISSCVCFISYEMFPGFDGYSTTAALYNLSDIASASVTKTTLHGILRSTKGTIKPKTKHKKKAVSTKATTKTTTSTTSPIPTTIVPSLQPVMVQRFNCSEDEKPFNIGAYEVPTQRDMVKLIQKTLVGMFNRYQGKALCFLKDIHEATKATSAIEKKCHSSRKHRTRYRACVKQVSNTCKTTTKSFVIMLERQRLDVSAFIEGTICNVTEMKADPLQLIKTLAMEEAALEFALPGFLRLLGACSVYCDIKLPKSRKKKPLRHMTDQDLVVKHFLTKKNYLQLMKGSK